MPAPDTYTVVIATRNRPVLLERAIRSVRAQEGVCAEVIVVDDCSDVTPSTASGIVYVRNPVRRGPGPSRNRGIELARTDFVVILDDDDTLVPGALALIEMRINRIRNRAGYPCFQFARSNGRLDCDFAVLGLSDLVQGRLSGDFTPVLQRAVFMEQGLRYPDSLVGGENLLWFDIARRYGIPTWSEVVTVLGNEAPTRLCSVDHQLARPLDYAAIQERFLLEFGTDLLAISKAYYVTRQLGAATYWLLAGNRAAGREHLRRASRVRLAPQVAIGWAASCLPESMVRLLFRCYRSCTM